MTHYDFASVYPEEVRVSKMSKVTEEIMTYVLTSMANYGLISVPRSASREILNLILRIASACILVPFMFLDITDPSKSIGHYIGIIIVFLGAFAGSIIGGRFPKIGRYTILNILVTFAAGLVTCGIVYGIFLFEGVAIADGLRMFILVIISSAMFPWLLGLLKSFRLRHVIRYMAQDDGKETVERNFGTIIRQGLRPDTWVVQDIGWNESIWTPATYKYHLGFLGMCAKIVFALFYGLFVGSIISIAATLPAIVRVANPGESFRVLPAEEE